MLLILILYNIFYTIFFIQLLFLKDIFYTAFIFFTAHRNLRLLYCTVLHYLYCITVRSAATQTTLWGSPGPRFEPRTDDLQGQGNKPLDHYTSLFKLYIFAYFFLILIFLYEIAAFFTLFCFFLRNLELLMIIFTFYNFCTPHF